MEIIVLHNQSFLDLALQYTGAVENAFLIALENEMSLTDDLAVGNWLMANSKKLTANKEILNYYQSKNVQPATAISQQLTASSQPEGIDYWAVNVDFIIR